MYNKKGKRNKAIGWEKERTSNVTFLPPVDIFIFGKPAMTNNFLTLDEGNVRLKCF